MEGVAGALSEEGFTGALIPQRRGVNRPSDHEKEVAEEASIALELRVDNVERVAGRSNEREGVLEYSFHKRKESRAVYIEEGHLGHDQEVVGASTSRGGGCIQEGCTVEMVCRASTDRKRLPR